MVNSRTGHKACARRGAAPRRRARPFMTAFTFGWLAGEGLCASTYCLLIALRYRLSVPTDNVFPLDMLVRDPRSIKYSAT